MVDTSSASPTIAFVGLATSHPLSDATTIARLRPQASLRAWDDDEHRRTAFAEAVPDVPLCDSLAAAVADAEGVVLSARSDRIAGLLAEVAELGVPVFVNKPAAATREQLAALEAIWSRAPERLMTTSVLRFAEPVRRLRETIDPADVLAAHVLVRHDVGRWEHGSTPWQDDPAVGGGLVVTMGIHGVELLVSVLGPDVALGSCIVSRRRYRGLRSGDLASIALRWSNGTLGTVDVLGVAAEEGYALRLHTEHGTHEVRLDTAGDDPLGYRRTVERFLAMVEDGAPSPVPWAETRAILAALIGASQAAQH
ncbi:Gfo/Idh/MocA family oxidoreductase [Agrococcus sp. Marseille-Q4369]|uniref:Gfo/Idh/MocA family protein n=1 Tax=Agrococcus sp. Marseille-Q4369 TaxID=2810513 RepID=UPI001B8C6C21|nr:Gfo/Idh/MocA family oxidoreductase [Agrococcus sp. Marseille-Q4369]QUW18108.1 Gfo/Idh/MocA family oxidoreductase [Agrococcus sp. Marseille-Q4369]